MNTKHPTRIKIRGKEWDVVQVLNATEPGSVGEEEILYILSGWGDDPIGYFNWQIDDLIKDGEAQITSYD